MRTDSLHSGDLVEAKVQGTSFLARVVGQGSGLTTGTVKVEPVDDWPTWRFLRPWQIVRRVETQQQLRTDQLLERTAHA